jgi:hypothetical protein
MNLSMHFTMAELTASDIALRKGIKNVPPADLLHNAFTLARGLERVRGILCFPMHSSSGYRCPELNAAVGGSDDSDHMKFLADDFTCPQFGTPKQVAEAIAQHAEIVQFKQLIYEGTWVHIAFHADITPARKEVFTIQFINGKPKKLNGIV